MSATLSEKEIAPELIEFYCQPCFEKFFVSDIIKQQYKTVTITMDLQEPKEDDNGFSWGILCMGRDDENSFAAESKPHLAKFRITRHKIV
ncbi:MAG: hypothetical protein WA549_06020, partial [Thermoplasmata archaeon]